MDAHSTTALNLTTNTTQQDPGDRTKVMMLYANQTENDILLQEELEEIAAKCPERFKVCVCVLDRGRNGMWLGPGWIVCVCICFLVCTCKHVCVCTWIKAEATPLPHTPHQTNEQLFYTLDRPPTKWKQGIGFITPEMVKEHCPPYSARSLYLVCGPPAMYVDVRLRTCA